MTRLFITLLVLLPVALLPVIGWWVLLVSAGLALLLLQQTRSTRLARLALLLALLGGVIGIGSAATALLAVAAEPAYAPRAGFGWLALVLAALAACGGLMAGRWPVASAAITVMAGLAGAVAINLFWINSFYLAAVPCWLASGVLATLGVRGQAASPNPPPGA